VAQQRRQRNIYMAVAAIGVVVVVVAVLITVSLTGGKKTPTTVNTSSADVAGTFALTPAILNQVESVPVAKLVSAAVACASSSKCIDQTSGATPVQKLPSSATPLTLNGHPEILYIGAEYCPYCAAERWSLLEALSKFGKFSPLRGTTSSSTDIYASTPTFSFYKSSFTSQYLSFVPVEEETNSSAALQSPTAAQEALFAKWDAAPYVSAADAGSIPFIYFDGKYIQIGAQYIPAPISGMGFQSAVNTMTSGTSPVSKASEAVGGFLLGDICAITHNAPASVCSQVPAKLMGINTSSPSFVLGSRTPTTGGKTTTTKASNTPTTKAPKTASTTAKASS
jgi:hypothetical protein